MGVALLLLAAAVLFLWRLDGRGLWSTHEARAARIARTMVQTGNWVELHLASDTPTYQKPPLYYWTVAAFAKLNGGEVTPLATRLPAALSAILTVLVVYLLGRELKDHATGMLAGLVMMTCMRVLWVSRVANLDSMLLLWTTLAMYFFLWAWRRGGNWLRYLPMFAAIALGIMTKGHIALVAVGAVVGPFLVWQFLIDWHRALRAALGCVPGLLLCLAVTTPWFVVMHYRTGGKFTTEYVIYHHFARAGLCPAPPGFNPFEAKTQWYHYLVRIWYNTFPWSVFLPGGLVWLVGRRRWFSRPKMAFVLLWLVALMAMFSAMSFRKHEYILPLYPAIALLVAVFLTEFVKVRGESRFWDRLLMAAFIGLCVIGLLVGGAATLMLNDDVFEWVHGLLHNENDHFMFEVSRDKMMENLGLTLGTVGAIFLGCALSVVFWLRRKEQAALVMLGAATGTLMLFYVAVFVPAINEGRSHAAFVAEALRHIKPDDLVVVNVGEDHELCYLLGMDVIVPGASGRWNDDEGIHGTLDRARRQGRGAWCLLYRSVYDAVPPGPRFRLVAETRGYHRKPVVLLSYKSPDE